MFVPTGDTTWPELMTTVIPEVELQLNEIAEATYDDPFKFVQLVYPWGCDGTPRRSTTIQTSGSGTS